MPKNKALVNALLDRDTTGIVIATKVGIHESRFSKILNGHVDPTPDEKKALAKALRKSISELFPPESAVA